MSSASETNFANKSCSVGELFSSSCESTAYTKNREVVLVSENLSSEQQELLKWRTNLELGELSTICSHHICLFITYFESNQKACCDPFKRHSVSITNKKNLRKISLEKAKSVKESKNLHLIPGKLLCSNCRKAIFTDDSIEKEKTYLPNEDDSYVEFETAARSFEKEKLNDSLQNIDVTPIKLKSVAEHSKKSYSQKLQQASTQMKKKLTYVLNISSDEEEDNSCESDKQKLVDRTKCQDLDYLA